MAFTNALQYGGGMRQMYPDFRQAQDQQQAAAQAAQGQNGGALAPGIAAGITSLFGSQPQQPLQTQNANALPNQAQNANALAPGVAAPQQTPAQFQAANMATYGAAPRADVAAAAAPSMGQTTNVGDPTIGQSTNISAPPTPDAYATALQAAYAPMFDKQRQALNANQAANGTLTSGAGNYNQQELTAQNNATLARELQPLIQQGFGQQFQANVDNANSQNSFENMLKQQQFAGAQQNAGAANATDAAYRSQQFAGQEQYANANNTANLAQRQQQFSADAANAGATNSFRDLLQGQSFSAAEANAQRRLQAGEFNANLQNGNQQANLAAYNQYRLSQLGYANQTYRDRLQNYYGLTSQGLSAQNGAASQGASNQYNAYGQGADRGAAAGAALGSAIGGGSFGGGGGGGLGPAVNLTDYANFAGQ